MTAGRAPSSGVTDDRAPEVSVVIVHWNTPELLRACVASLPRAAGALSFEVIVVDNGSCAAGAAHLSRATWLRVLRNEENRGFAAAANQGAVLARGRRLLFLNCEVVVPESSLPALAAALDGDPRVAGVAPDAVGGDGAGRFPGMKFLNPINHALGLLGAEGPGPLRRRLHADGCAARLVRVDWARASVLLVSRRLFRAVGGFDEGFFLYEEDEDLAWRLRRRGYAIVVDTSVRVEDSGGASTALAGAWPAAELYRSQLRFVRRRCGGFGEHVYRTVVTLALLAKGVRSRLRTGSSAPADVTRPSVTMILGSLWKGRHKASIAEA